MVGTGYNPFNFSNSIQEPALLPLAKNAESYAKKYLKKILMSQNPKLSIACEQRGISYSDLFENWVKNTMDHRQLKLILTNEEVPFAKESWVVASTDFLRFSKDYLKS